MANNMQINANQIREHIYVENNVPCNLDMPDNEFIELKNESARNIIIFVKQLKRINTVRQLISHIEQQINVEHIAQINNLQANFNIQLVNLQVVPPVASPIPHSLNQINTIVCGNSNVNPVGVNQVGVNQVGVNQVYFTALIYDTIVNSYNASNDNWTCPYQYNQLVINLQNIRDLLAGELITLNLNAATVRTSLSRYQKVKDYRALLLQITTNI